jgi:hypothetical protein
VDARPNVLADEARPNTLSAIKPRNDTTPGQYVVELWDGAQGQILASGEYRIIG